jgi:hypothetical protein
MALGGQYPRGMIMRGEAVRATGKQRVRWVLLSTFGLAGGLAVGLGLSEPIEAVVGMMLVTPVVLTIAGSVLGTSQSLALWRFGRSGVLWVAATAVGLGVGMTLGIVAAETIGRSISGQQVRLVSLSPLARVWGLGLVGSITGLAVGLAQRAAVRNAASVNGPWVLTCTVGFGVGLPGGGLAADLLLGGLRSLAGFALFLGVAGLITGLVTAGGAGRVIGARDGRIGAA